MATEALPERWGIRLIDFPQYGLSRVQAPFRCPRCKNTTLDAVLDPTRNGAVASWVAYKTPNMVQIVFLVILIFATLGIWLVVFGLWSIAMIPVRAGQKRAAKEAASQCIRSHCRSCGLEWYKSETERIEAQNP